MTDERDPRLSKRYRELEPLEPPAALDQKILDRARDAARETIESRAPLVAPAGRHRWYYSLAAAAVLVFAVALTFHMDRERPDPEMTPATSVRGEIKPATPAESKPAGQASGAAPRFTPDPQTAAKLPRADEPRSETPRRLAEEAAPPRADQAADEARASREFAATAKRQTAAPSYGAAPTAAPAAAAPEDPERWLERIAELRSRGRHVDADRELANFRKAYPDYRLSEMMRERVEGTTTSR